MDECQALKGSLEDCGVIGFVAALFLNREHFCSTCCEDPYCNDLGVLQHLIPIPNTTTTVITSSIPSTVTTEEQQTTTGALVETSRLVSTSTKPQTNTQAVEEQESTLTPTTDDASHKLASTDLTPDKPDTTMIQDPKTAKKGTETTAETSSSVVTSETPFTTTHAVDAVDESTSLLMKDITTHGLVSTSIFSVSDTTQTAVITAESSTSEENAETSTESGVDETTESKLTKKTFAGLSTTSLDDISTERNHLQTSPNSFIDLVSTSRAISLQDSFTSWYGYTASTLTTTGMTSSYPVESSQDYEKYCNSSKEAVFGVTRRGLHGLSKVVSFKSSHAISKS
ncbi:hypothetical protein HOLleu_41891 [Holothuria leucospilota]|uniref:Uncharacterized protein n=1 Tax=Holothuria leucospilota TaxID=206669 RepID=A0A9Q0YEK2_HOLLE|nr:hypothetical protein HOLleu_41891 [Holothuria leucospilota]